MTDELDNQLIEFMRKDTGREYTIPDIMTGISVKNREKVVTSLTRLEERKIIQSRPKGRWKVYRILKPPDN